MEEQMRIVLAFALALAGTPVFAEDQTGAIPGTHIVRPLGIIGWTLAPPTEHFVRVRGAEVALSQVQVMHPVLSADLLDPRPIAETPSTNGRPTIVTTPAQ
jgi:hypothetical protein